MNSRRSLFTVFLDKLSEHSLLVPTSGRPHALPTDSSLLSLPTRTRASLNPDSRKITPDNRKKQVEKRAQCESHRHATTIDMLTDNVLLDIFDHVSRLGTGSQVPVWKWHRLAHVCQRWRQIIFASPLRLDLQLLCTHGRSATKDLGCWPAFPIVIDYIFWQDFAPNGGDKVVAALKHPGRVRQLKLMVESSLWRKMATVMQEPFPTLTHLSILSDDRDLPILPGRFMGGSAPCLREIRLSNIPIPTLSNLLSSASDLVKLELVNIPLTGSISPATLVACLAVLPRLGSLSIAFQSRSPRVGRINLPPETRVLPALTSFSFKGGCGYLEDFMARIDTPALDSIDITYSNQLNFRVSQLPEFINRSGLRLSRLGRAEISGSKIISFRLSREVNPEEFAITIRTPSCEGIDESIRNMAQVLSQVPTILSDVVRLEIKSDWGFVYDDMNDIEWLELFHLFTSVEILRVSGEFADSVAHAFKGMTVEIAAQVLPALDLLFLEDQLAWTIKKILAIFRGCGRTLAIVRKERSGSEGNESEDDPYW